MSETREKLELLKKEILETKEKIKELQENCPHPNFTGRWVSNRDCAERDEAWWWGWKIECPDCGFSYFFEDKAGSEFPKWDKVLKADPSRILIPEY